MYLYKKSSYLKDRLIKMKIYKKETKIKVFTMRINSQEERRMQKLEKISMQSRSSIIRNSLIFYMKNYFPEVIES